MNAFERYLAVYDDKKRFALDRIPLHVQYIREEFITKNKIQIMKNYSGFVHQDDYFDIPMILGFDSVFAPFPSSYKSKSFRIRNSENELIRIGEDGQRFPHTTPYYKGGYISALEILDELEANIKIINASKQIQKTIHYYEYLSPSIFPILTVDGIFDRVWRAMGMSEFSRHFKANSRLYQKLIKFYGNLAKINIGGLIDATGSRGRVITILDDVAYKRRTMISPSRWASDFLPIYKELTSMIVDAGMIPQIHTDGNVTDLIPLIIKAGFLGLQGFEGGCDPDFINENFPQFVIIGFGDVSFVLPYGSSQEIEYHVKYLINTLKENRHFIIGPSTVIFGEIPLENVISFVNYSKTFGKY